VVKLSASPEVADDIIDEHPAIETIARIARHRLSQMCVSLSIIVLPLANRDQHRNMGILAAPGRLGYLSPNPPRSGPPVSSAAPAAEEDEAPPTLVITDRPSGSRIRRTGLAR
jgi:hypothetical protein